jgi:hypothetical protein
MSQPTASHGPHAKSEDEDVADPRARRPEHQPGVRPRRPAGQPSDDGGIGPDEPDDGEFELAGDLGPADLGPLAPNATDPDAASGRIRKIRRES